MRLMAARRAFSQWEGFRDQLFPAGGESAGRIWPCRLFSEAAHSEAINPALPGDLAPDKAKNLFHPQRFVRHLPNQRRHRTIAFGPDWSDFKIKRSNICL